MVAQLPLKQKVGGSIPFTSTMSNSDYKNKCDECGMKGFLVARIFWRMIDEKWKWLCKDCWEKKNLKIFKIIERINNGEV